MRCQITLVVTLPVLCRSTAGSFTVIE